MIPSPLLEGLRLDVRVVSLSHNIPLHHTAAAPLPEECLNRSRKDPYLIVVDAVTAYGRVGFK